MTFIDRPAVYIDLARVRDNAIGIARDCGVPVIAVIKAQAYGLGSRQIVRALAEVVDSFYCFGFQEAIEADTRATGRPTIALTCPHDVTVAQLQAHYIRPAVWTAEQAGRLRGAHPVIAVDTGMQRFACPVDQVDAVIAAGDCNEAFTHATRAEHARLLVEACGGRGLRLHAASTSLLNEPEARLNAVRPGLALYHDAVRVTTHLTDTRKSTRPFGYGGRVSSTGHHGVIIGGYTTGLKPGPCLINGRGREIVECGMQTSFVEIGPADRSGDEVVLLGDDITLDDVASVRATTPHETLWRMASCGTRSYVG